MHSGPAPLATLLVAAASWSAHRIANPPAHDPLTILYRERVGREGAWAVVVASALLFACRRASPTVKADPAEAGVTRASVECRDGVVLEGGQPAPDAGEMTWPRVVATAAARSGAQAAALARVSCDRFENMRGCARETWNRLYQASDGGVSFHGTIELSVELSLGKVTSAQRVAGDDVLARCVADVLRECKLDDATSATGTITIAFAERKWKTHLQQHFIEIPSDIDASGVMGAMGASYPALTRCYEDGRTRDPKLAGMTFMQFEVDALGKARKIDLGAAMKVDAITGKCMVDTIAGIVFPKPTSAPAKIVWPLEYEWTPE